MGKLREVSKTSSSLHDGEDDLATKNLETENERERLEGGC